MFQLILMLALTPISTQTKALAKTAPKQDVPVTTCQWPNTCEVPVTTCQWPNTCAAANEGPVQTCVWPNKCAAEEPTVQTCVWPNKCS